jgi:hypothetical protein
MPQSCPKCNTALPEHDGLQYRFCPRCGAGIKAAKKEADASYPTIPPDLNTNIETKTEQKAGSHLDEGIADGYFNQTLEPAVSIQSKVRPAIIPPPGPPPPSFYHGNSVDSKSIPEKYDQNRSGKLRKALIVLILTMGMVLLLWGIYFMTLT